MTQTSDHAHSPAPACDAELALLRRYLRAVLGDQSVGDRLALALRAGGAEGCGPVHDEADVLCGAMRRWRQLHADAAPAAPFTPAAIAQAISPVRGLERQVGVMMDVFRLSAAQAATAIDRSEGEITMLLSGARTRAAAPIGAPVLVVEDDPVVARYLAALAEDAGASEVAVASDAEAAFAAAAARPPAIVVCDFDLGPGLNGAAVVRRLASAHDCVSVFVTAHPAKVLSGTDGEPAFIIAKPFEEGVVRAALAYAGTAERPDLLAA